MTEFGIQIEDGSDVLSQFALEVNKKRIDLYDWQRRGIEYFFKHNNKTIFEVPTGVGKTILAIELLKIIHNTQPEYKCLIVVPKNVILETGWFKELYDAGYNLQDIGIYYGLGKEYCKITITNMQSIKNVAVEVFDIIIWDEIHNYGTKRLLPYLELPIKYKIGLSATVERMDNKHWEIIKYFDYNVFKYSPHEAISEGVLNAFNFYNIAVEMDVESYDAYIELTQELNAIFKAGGGFNKIMRTNSGIKFRMLSLMNKRKQLLNNYPRKFDIAKFICLKHTNEKILIFNQFNAQTTKLYWNLLDSGVKSRVMHSGIRQEDRQKNLMDFRNNKFNVLLTTKVLDEGYNLPSIEVAVIMAGDSTSKQTIQRLGRVLRKKKKESVLYQVYCKSTIEEEQANVRSILFKQLASHFNDYIYKLNDKELILDE